jgi:hypothetical protein
MRTGIYSYLMIIGSWMNFYGTDTFFITIIERLSNKRLLHGRLLLSPLLSHDGEGGWMRRLPINTTLVEQKLPAVLLHTAGRLSPPLYPIILSDVFSSRAMKKLLAGRTILPIISSCCLMISCTVVQKLNSLLVISPIIGHRLCHTPESEREQEKTADTYYTKKEN